MPFLVQRREYTFPSAGSARMWSWPRAVYPPVVAGARPSVSAVSVTLGIDLSATDAKTAACAIRWENGRGSVDVPRRGLSNDDLRVLITDAAAAGVDAPFSWPVPFPRTLVEHGSTGGWPADYRSPRYQLRATDLFVDGIARRPLSVSTDRIGVTAMRCARLLQEFAEDRGKRRLDLTGRDGIYEVYPAAALSAWGAKAAGFDAEGYKSGSEAKVRRAKLVDTFAAATADWLHFPGAAQQECVTRDDALDSFIAALATRAAHLGRTRAPETVEQQQLAPVEGWIHVPEHGSLSMLVANRATSRSAECGRGRLGPA